MKGFTLIEFMIVCVILLIIGTILFGALAGGRTIGDSNVSVGINGFVETRCIDGFKFVVSDRGRYGGTGIEQIKDTEGKAIPCGERYNRGF